MRKYIFRIKIFKNGKPKTVEREIELNRELNVGDQQELREFIEDYEMANALENGYIDSYEIIDCKEKI